MRTRSARLVAVALALVMLVVLPLGLVSCSSLSRTGVVTGGSQTEDITGIWELKLKPIYDYRESAHKASISNKTSTFEVWLYQYGDAIIGFSGPFHFQGQRDGDRISLDVFQAGGKKNVDHEANLELSVEDPKTISGKSMDSDLGHEHRGLGLAQVSAKRIKDAPPLKSLGSPAWYMDVMKIIAGTIPGRVWFKENSANFGFMGLGPIKNGGGYYMMGDHGPGDEDYAAWTCYYPLEWKAYGSRNYHFTVGYGGNRRSLDSLDGVVKKAGAKISKTMGYGEDTNKLRADIKDFYGQHGDFAISLGASDNTWNMDIYINLKDEGKAKGASSHRLIKNLKANLLKTHGSVKSKVSILTGTEIEDTWELWRPTFIVEGKGLHFLYLIGTAHVYYD